MFKNKIYYGWFIVTYATIITCTLIGLEHSFSIFFKSLAAEFELSRFLTSSIFSTYMLLRSIFAVLGGWIMDKYGPRRVFILGAIVSGASLLLTSQTTDFWQLFLTYSVLLSIGAGFIITNAMALVSRWFDKKRGLALGIVNSGIGLGTVIMSPIAAYLIVSFGWRISYIIIGLAALVIVIPAASYLKKDPAEIGSYPDGEAVSLSKEPREANNAFSVDFTIKQALKTVNYWLIFLIAFSFSFCIMMVLTHLVPYATDLNISPVRAATILSLCGIFSVVARLLMGRLSDTIGRKAALISCMIIMAGSLIWLTVSQNLWMFYVFSLLFGLGWGGLSVGHVALAADVFGVRNLGMILGSVSIGFAMGSAIGPVLAGTIFDTTGSYTITFISGIALILLVAVLCYIFLPKLVPKESI